MLLIRKPSETKIRQFLEAQEGQPFSYPRVGASRDDVPADYTIDHNRVRIGDGTSTFDRAVAALRAWKMFELGWLELFRPETPIRAGATVAVLVRCFGVWSLNACRIAYVLDESAPVRRHGFAYGTLPEHAERGEERFSIEWSPRDDSVWYDILAFSRPNQLLPRLAYPLTRRLQRRFVRDSMDAMRRAVGGSPADASSRRRDRGRE